MDDYEHPRVRYLRSPATLYDRRYLNGFCPQCGATRPAGNPVYCGPTCVERADKFAPIQPMTEEEKKRWPGGTA